MVHHPPNFVAGWSLILLAFATGAVIGLFFHRDGFLGGYASFRRRIVRLGHIALAALGMLNVLFALSPLPLAGSPLARGASVLLIVGAVAMPSVCFLTGWRKSFRHLFFIPVAALIGGVGCILLGALR